MDRAVDAGSLSPPCGLGNASNGFPAGHLRRDPARAASSPKATRARSDPDPTCGIITEGLYSGDEFDDEFGGLPVTVQDDILATAQVLELRGPSAGRPRVDTLNGS
jgi:hypothetical protein